MRSSLVSFCVLVGITLCAAAAVTNEALLQNDIKVLNYALTLEHLEATFYNMYQAAFTSQNFIDAGLTAEDYDYFNMIAGHENDHVNVLSQVIANIGGTPVPVCNYDFGVTTVQEYIALARVLESTGVMAYDGALNHIHNRAYQRAAATIATVEARHAEYLNLLNNQAPWPGAFDMPKTPEEIKAKIAGLITSCPYTLELPEIIVVPRSMARVSFVDKDSITKPSAKLIHGNDLDTLNYALVLEHLESAFYEMFYAMFDAQAYTDAGFDPAIRDYINLIRRHEKTHVQALTAVIRGANGNPHPACTYDFSSITTVSEFLNAAAVFESVGVAAYDGAAKTITNKAYLQTAATIATIEARHAGYLNMVIGQSPFPNAFDASSPPLKIAKTVSQFQTCGFTIELPEVLYISVLKK